MDVNIEIKVKISDLISHLKANKEKHILEYQEAKVLYFENLAKKLKTFQKSIKNKEFRSDNYAPMLAAPVNAEKQYDQYIKMLEMSQEETMTISTHEYNCFVEDKWHWAVAASTTNKFYTSNR